MENDAVVIAIIKSVKEHLKPSEENIPGSLHLLKIDDPSRASEVVWHQSHVDGCVDCKIRAY